MLKFPIHNINSTGKTLLVESVVHCLDVPFVICDCRKLTHAGYEVEDVESIISKVLQAADYSVDRAQTGMFKCSLGFWIPLPNTVRA
jgi:ATP-dependent protease Clp ATPase subunit